MSIECAPSSDRARPARAKRASAAVLASVLLGVPVVAQATVYSADYRPIASTTNEAVVTIENGTPRTTTLTNCDPEPSFITVEYDSITSEITLTDGVLCGSDLSLPFNVTVEDITVRLGASAQAVNPYPDPIVPLRGIVGPDDIAVFESDSGGEEYTVLFSATITVGSFTSDPIIPVGGSFSGPLAIDDVSGRLTLRDLIGVSQGALDPDGSAGPIDPLLVTAVLTLSIESVTFPPEFSVFRGDFESGGLDGWSESVPVR